MCSFLYLPLVLNSELLRAGVMSNYSTWSQCLVYLTIRGILESEKVGLNEVHMYPSIITSAWGLHLTRYCARPCRDVKLKRPELCSLEVHWLIEAVSYHLIIHCRNPTQTSLRAKKKWVKVASNSGIAQSQIQGLPIIFFMTNSYSSKFLLLLFFGSTKSTLARHILNPLNHVPSPFCVSYFSYSLMFLPEASLRPQSFNLCFPSSWDYRYRTPIQLICWDGV
jgi:hypothetical protein